VDNNADENGQDTNALLTNGIRTMAYNLTAVAEPMALPMMNLLRRQPRRQQRQLHRRFRLRRSLQPRQPRLYDADKDGTRNGTETGLPNVTVNLYRDSNNDGTPDGGSIASMLTDTNGFYRFNNLTADTYIVEVVPSLGYASTVDAGDADVEPTMMMTTV